MHKRPVKVAETTALPDCFCWTRFGTEAGQLIGQILHRKEQERIANRGIFYWGIGNPIGPSMSELLRRTANPEVLFSPIKSPSRPQDVAPPAVVAWTSGETLDGELYPLPGCSLVTSGQDPQGRKQTHYALVCFSENPLFMAPAKEKVALRGLCNIVTGRPVAASQATAVVQRNGSGPPGTAVYEIAIRAKLVYPHFLRLRDPVLLTDIDFHLDWEELVRQAWARRRVSQNSSDPLHLPFPEL